MTDLGPLEPPWLFSVRRENHLVRYPVRPSQECPNTNLRSEIYAPETATCYINLKAQAPARTAISRIPGSKNKPRRRMKDAFLDPRHSYRVSRVFKATTQRQKNRPFQPELMANEPITKYKITRVFRSGSTRQREPILRSTRSVVITRCGRESKKPEIFYPGWMNRILMMVELKNPF